MNCSYSDHAELIKLKANVVNAIRQQMERSGIVESYYNKITGGTGACESVNTAFILANTPELSYLSQTDQLLMEAEILELGLPGIWTLGRSFRNEPRAGDGRHLSEFALLEFEARDMDLSGLLEFQQELLDITIKIALECPIIYKSHKDRLQKYLDKKATVYTYSSIISTLQNGGVSIKWGDDFSSSIEEMICLLFDGPVQVTHYPESIKFFNMYRTDRSTLTEEMSIDEYNKNLFTVDCADLLLPWAGETFGASRREEDYTTMKLKLRESLMFKQMTQIRADETNDGVITDDIMDASWQPFVSYLEIFNPERNLSTTRSGFGLGMGRLIQFLLGSSSVIVF